MAMTYSVLTASKSTAGSLKSWVNRDTIDPDTILTETQALIYQTLRHWKMKSDQTATMTVGQDYIDLPDDFIDMRDLRITGIYASRLRKADERFVQDRYCYDGTGMRVNQIPQHYYLSGLAAVLDNPPDIAYSTLISYWARPAALALSNETNFLTTDLPRLLRTGCMLIACEFEKEVGQGQFDRSYWQGQFDKLMAEAQIASSLVDAPYDATPEFA